MCDFLRNFQNTSPKQLFQSAHLLAMVYVNNKKMNNPSLFFLIAKYYSIVRIYPDLRLPALELLFKKKDGNSLRGTVG